MVFRIDFSAKSGFAKRLPHASNGVTGNGVYCEFQRVNE